MDYISIAEAVVATGKSSSTIRRIIKRLADEGPPDTVKKESTSQGDKYYVRRDILWKELGIQEPSTNDSQADTAETPVVSDGRLVEVLYEQLQKKDEQLQEKDKQIELLLERQRETNILINTYQQKLLPMADTTVSTQKTAVEKKREALLAWVLVVVFVLIIGTVVYFSWHPLR